LNGLTPPEKRVVFTTTLTVTMAHTADSDFCFAFRRDDDGLLVWEHQANDAMMLKAPVNEEGIAVFKITHKNIQYRLVADTQTSKYMLSYKDKANSPFWFIAHQNYFMEWI